MVYQNFKKSISIILVFILCSFGFSNPMKEEIDKFEQYAKRITIPKKFDLIDYFPHADGEIDIYQISNNSFYVYIGIYSSMYKRIYSLKIQNDLLYGYEQKYVYQSPYDTKDNVIEYEKEISMKNEDVYVNDSGIYKLSKVLFEIIDSEL